MQTIYFFTGLPASGKTESARSILEHDKKARRVNKDLLREMLFFSKWTKAREQLVKDVEYMIADKLLAEGYNLIVDNTHLLPEYKDKYQDLAHIHHATFLLFDYTNVPVMTCLERDYIREDSVGYNAILGMAERYLPEQFEQFRKDFPDNDKMINYLNSVKLPTTNVELPPCIIVDVDGTLAQRGNRGIYDASLAHTDEVNTSIRRLVNHFYYLNYIVFVFSGREDVEVNDKTCYDITIEWLENKGIKYDYLMLRKKDDHRTDSVVKKEMYLKHIYDKFDCRYVLDDRDQVVKMWREDLGLCTLQVNWGKF